MTKERYKEIMGVKDPSTVGLTKQEKLQYIKYFREQNSIISRNWSEAEMLREFDYHDRGFYLGNFLGPLDVFDLEGRGEEVGFESEQNLKTYVRRIIGNTWCW